MVEDGAHVEMDDPICELESEKATFELNAEVSGTLKHLAKEGDELSIGAIVGTIEEGAGQAAKAATEEVAKPQEMESAGTIQKKLVRHLKWWFLQLVNPLQK